MFLKKNTHSCSFAERLATTQSEVEGQHYHVEELAAEKARVQQRYDELSAAVDARVDQLEVRQGAEGRTWVDHTYLNHSSPNRRELTYT